MPKHIHHGSSEGRPLSEMAVCIDCVSAAQYTHQSTGAQQRIQLQRLDLLTGVTESVMDLASPSISINTLTENS